MCWGVFHKYVDGPPTVFCNNIQLDSPVSAWSGLFMDTQPRGNLLRSETHFDFKLYQVSCQLAVAKPSWYFGDVLKVHLAFLTSSCVHHLGSSNTHMHTLPWHLRAHLIENLLNFIHDGRWPAVVVGFQLLKLLEVLIWQAILFSAQAQNLFVVGRG